MNDVRGDVALPVDGVEQRLRLTFGALAEIETKLGLTSLEELARRLARPSASDLMIIVAALLRGGGCDEVAGRIGAANVDPGEVSRAVARVFSEAFR